MFAPLGLLQRALLHKAPSCWLGDGVVPAWVRVAALALPEVQRQRELLL